MGIFGEISALIMPNVFGGQTAISDVTETRLLFVFINLFTPFRQTDREQGALPQVLGVIFRIKSSILSGGIV